MAFKKSRFLLLAATAGVAAAGAYAYIEYRKSRLQDEAARLWQLLGLRPGARIGEVGAGSGEMAVVMAQRAGPHGHVYATEIEAGKLRKLERKQEKVANLKVVASTPHDCNLPANSCDAIYVRAAYHHFTDPAAMNASVMRALRPGGTLAVIDFPPHFLLSLFPPKGIPEDRGGHGIPPAILAEEMRQAGFDPVQSVSDWPGRCYCVAVQKPIAA
jgi:ubiquinone/menaquinone biosynthesis C-methylase UbiE